jgi:hypothetical protein
LEEVSRIAVNSPEAYGAALVAENKKQLKNEVNHLLTAFLLNLFQPEI